MMSPWDVNDVSSAQEEPAGGGVLFGTPPDPVDVTNRGERNPVYKDASIPAAPSAAISTGNGATPRPSSASARPPGAGVIRKAVTADVVAIQQLINGFAEQDLMLHRSLSELYENVRDFYVVEEDGGVVGCGALHVTWKDLAELKSLAVAEHAQGRGYGRALIRACMDEARALGVARIFALTYVPQLFEKMGWARQDKASLPRKVWTECIHCPKFPDCGEIAVTYDVPPLESAS